MCGNVLAPRQIWKEGERGREAGTGDGRGVFASLVVFTNGIGLGRTLKRARKGLPR